MHRLNLIMQMIFVCTGISQTFYASKADDALNKSYVKSVYSLPITLDPILMNDTASLVVSNLIYDGLLKFSPHLEIEPAIAESWSTSHDGKEITFNLKENVKFHDGSTLTASDVKTSLVRLLLPESRVRKYYDCIVGADEKKGTININNIGINVVNSKKLIIKLKNPFPPFLSVLAGATAKIFPEKLLNKRDFFLKPIGSGVFKFVSIDKIKKEVLLTSFKEYYGGASKITQMILKESNESEAIKLAESGKIHDLANWPLSRENEVFNSGNKTTAPVAATWIIGLNTTKKPFNDVHVRRAFRDSIDSEEFRQKFYPDALPAHGYVPFGLPGSKLTFESHKNVIKIPKDKITITIPAELAKATEMKSYFEGSLKKKGWNCEVVILPWDKLMDGYSRKSFQSFLVSMNMDYPDAEFLLRNFESHNSDNFSGLKNSKLDDLIKKSRTLQDRKKREVVYEEALKLLNNEAVTVNLFHPKSNIWTSNCVDGLEANILSDVYIDYSKVSLKTNCYERVSVR